MIRPNLSPRRRDDGKAGSGPICAHTVFTVCENLAAKIRINHVGAGVCIGDIREESIRRGVSML